MIAVSRRYNELIRHHPNHMGYCQRDVAVVQRHVSVVYHVHSILHLSVLSITPLLVCVATAAT